MSRPSHYSEQELSDLGIRFGRNVSIHRTVEFFGAPNIVLGSNVRIDCHAVISAGQPVRLGSYIHLSAGAMIFGSEGVDIGDFAGLSSRVAIYTASDDYTEGHLTNPTVPEKYRKVHRGKVVLAPHVIVGAGSVILPGVTLHRGAAVGALSLVRKDVEAFQVVSGSPARTVATRNRELLDRLEKELLAEHGGLPRDEQNQG